MSQLFVITMSTSVYICVCMVLFFAGLRACRQTHNAILCRHYRKPSFLFRSASEAYSAGMHILHMVGVSQVWRNKHYRRLRPCWMR